MTHPNNMTLWDTISCQRDHDDHQMELVTVHLGGKTGYHDYPPIPMRFARQFDMFIYPPSVYPVDGGPYCPAHDAVSETIVSHHIWEPRETIAALQVLESAAPGQIMIDIGSQIGWFSLLALSAEVDTIAMDADKENLRLLRASANLNAWGGSLMTFAARVDEDTEPFVIEETSVRLAKIDIEGAESHAIRVLWPLIEAGRVDHILMEVSPVFDDYYPALVRKLVDAGYRSYWLPPKKLPPMPFDSFPADIMTGRFDYSTTLETAVASCHQEDVWFQREGAAW